MSSSDDLHVPGSFGWATMFEGRKSDNGEPWRVVRINASSKVNLGELMSNVNRATVFLVAPGVYQGPFELNSNHPVLIEASDPEAPPPTIAPNDTSSATTVVLNAKAVELKGIRIVGGVGGAVHVRSGRAALCRCLITSGGPGTLLGEVMDGPKLQPLGMAVRCESPTWLSDSLIEGGAIGVYANVMSSIADNHHHDVGGGSVEDSGLGLRMQRCTVGTNARGTAPLGRGVVIDGATRVIVDDTLIHHAWYDGLVLGGASCGSVTGTSVERCSWCGIVFERKSRVWLNTCTVKSNGGNGVVCLNYSKPCLQHCRIAGNAGAVQLSALGSASAIFRHCNITASVPTADLDDGISPWGHGTPSPTRRNRVVSSSGESVPPVRCAIALLHSSDAVVEHCSVTVSVPGGLQHPTHDTVAMLFDGSATGSVKQNDISVVSVGPTALSGALTEKKQSKSAGSDETSLPPTAAFLNGPWQNVSVAGTNTTGGADVEQRTLEDAGCHDDELGAGPRGSTNRRMLTRAGDGTDDDGGSESESRTSSRASSPDASRRSFTARSETQAAAAPSSSGPGSSMTGSRLSLFGSDKEVKPQPPSRGRTSNARRASTASTLNGSQKPSSRRQSSHSPDIDSGDEGAKKNPARQRLAQREARAMSEIDEKEARRAASDRELAALKLEVDRLKARLRIKNQNEQQQKKQQQQLERAVSSGTPSTVPASAYRPTEESPRERQRSYTSTGRRSNAGSTFTASIPKYKREDLVGQGRRRSITPSQIARPTAPPGSRPSSARTRPTSATSRPGSSMAPRPPSAGGGSANFRHQHQQYAAPFRNPEVVGNFIWDRDRMDDFMRMRAPLDEVRVPLDFDDWNSYAPFTKRLHDDWLQRKKDHTKAEDAAWRSKKAAEPKLSRNKMNNLGARLHDSSMDHKRETMAEAKRRVDAHQEYHSRPHDRYAMPRRRPKKQRLTRSEMFELGLRLHDDSRDHKRELMEKVEERLARKEAEERLPQDHYAVKPTDDQLNRKLTKEEIAELGKRLHDESMDHKHKTLMQVVKELQNAWDKMPDDRAGQIIRQLLSTKKQPADSIYTYCSSLHLSHQDEDVAAAASDAIDDPSRLLERVASRSARRERDTGASSRHRSASPR